jgi:tetratricopeptide (TPR) repeat protein
MPYALFSEAAWAGLATVPAECSRIPAVGRVLLTEPGSIGWRRAAIRIAAAGIGGACAGPLGAVLGGWLGGAIGESASKLVEKFGEKAEEKLSEIVGEALGDSRLGRSEITSPTFKLEEVVRESLRRSLDETLHGISGEQFGDWFANWDRRLRVAEPINLSDLTPGNLAVPAHDASPAALQQIDDALDTLFRRTMERLDGEGAAIHKKSLSLNPPFRSMPPALFQLLVRTLPPSLDVHFRLLLTEPQNEQAWKQADLEFQRRVGVLLENISRNTDLIPQMAVDLAAFRSMLGDALEQALQQRLIGIQQLQAKDTEILRLTEELYAMKLQTATKVSGSDQAAVAALLSTGRFDAALRLKERQVEERRGEVERLAQDLYELGAIHEFRFDWPKALEAYREAWRLVRNPAYGFKYGEYSFKQSKYPDAIAVFEELLNVYTESRQIAATLDMIGLLYRATQRMKDAGKAYQNAMAIYVRLAETAPDRYRADIALTLNNWAGLNADTQRAAEAEQHYGEALRIYRDLAKENPAAYFPSLATLLNNFGLLYTEMNRTKDAEEAFEEALVIRRKIAASNPKIYLADVARTLNNLGLLYNASQRPQQAEQVYQEALSIGREHAKTQPEQYSLDLIMTLTNFGNLYSGMNQMPAAAQLYEEALGICRGLVTENSVVYSPYLASVLTNVGNFYRETGQKEEARKTYDEALTIRRELSTTNPETYLPDVATTLNAVGQFYESIGEMSGAEKAYKEALAIRTELSKSNRGVHLAKIALILNNLGNLYATRLHMVEAEHSYGDALSAYRELAIAAPEIYLPSVAMTLNNLANLYLATRRAEKAAESSKEAEGILEPIWRKQPVLYGDQMARIYAIHALLSESKEEACRFARRASEAAGDTKFKGVALTLIRRFCGGD